MSTYLKWLTHTTLFFNDYSSMINIYSIIIKDTLATKHRQQKQYLIYNNYKNKSLQPV